MLLDAPQWTKPEWSLNMVELSPESYFYLSSIFMMVLEFMWAKNTIVMPDGEIIFSFNLIAVITHNVRTTSCSRWFQSKEAPRGVGNQHILLSIFHSSGKGFSKQKLAERALSIFKTPSSRGVSPHLGQPKDNLKTPGQSRPEFLSRGFPI